MSREAFGYYKGTTCSWVDMMELDGSSSESEDTIEAPIGKQVIKSPKRGLEKEVTDHSEPKVKHVKITHVDSERFPRTRLNSEGTSNFSSSCSSLSSRNKELETDELTLQRRQKQIDYGKNTIGYDNYLKEIPKQMRRREHPKTPPKHLKFSRRAWEGLIKSWRIRLHAFDPSGAENDIEE